MKITFRVDASLKMGTGHVMRCLTLANALKEQGAECHFICREHPGNLIDKIQQAGFVVHSLPLNTNTQAFKQQRLNKENELFHAGWLGTSQAQDAQECQAILEAIQSDWLIVDHYALDKTWQQALQPYYKKLMVIDDLGDREHLADLLLDQNYASTSEKYQGLVPENCKILAGTQYTLLRPEFAQWREFSLKRRQNNPAINKILVTLGGVDPDNYTGKILAELAKADLSPEVEITIVMGATAPHLEAIKQQAAKMPFTSQVKVNVSNMAELMSNADLAIGAAGATTWERCCLGLPTIQLVIAENQRTTAEALAKAKAVILLNTISELPNLLAKANQWMPSLIANSKQITDGKGCESKVIPNLIHQDKILLKLTRFGEVKLINYTQLSEEESLEILTLRNHPHVRKWMFNQDEIPTANHLNFVTNLKENKDKYYFSVFKNNELLGAIYFYSIKDSPKSCEFGFFSNLNNRNPMAAFILEEAALQYAFQVKNLASIHAEVYPDNKSVIQLHKKYGFEEVASNKPGTLRFRLLNKAE